MKTKNYEILLKGKFRNIFIFKMKINKKLYDEILKESSSQ